MKLIKKDSKTLFPCIRYDERMTLHVRKVCGYSVLGFLVLVLGFEPVVSASARVGGIGYPGHSSLVLRRLGV